MKIDEYTTVCKPGIGVYTELRSKFLAFAFRAGSVSEAMDSVSEVKRKYHDARHVAYAYAIGIDGTTNRANDDGEPSGTAGRPILGQIRSCGLSDVVVVVVRYFGGVKLGTSRLGEAYRSAAAAALTDAGTETVFLKRRLVLRFAYEHMNGVMRLLREAGAVIIANTYDDGCLITVEIRLSLAEGLKERLVKIDTLVITDEQ